MTLPINTKIRLIIALACMNYCVACETPRPKPFVQAGEMAGTLAGEMAGTLAGNLAGSTAGDIAGENAGEMAGMSAGEMAGMSAGEMAGMSAGEMAGMSAGEMAGMSAGEMAGMSAGEMAGMSAGEMAGMSAGEMAGMSADEMAGFDLPSEPVEDCVGPTVSSEVTTNSAANNQVSCVTCEGAEPPNFILRDLNPNSCGVGQYYGIDAFQAQVTLVVLLRSSCGYCQSQLAMLEQMRFELLLEGHIVWLAVINETNTENNLVAFTTRSMSSILQDVEDVDAWQAMSDIQMVTQDDGQVVDMQVGGDKDDMYIYGTDGRLARFLDDDNREFSLNLSTPEGYMNLKTTLLEVLNQSTP